MFAVRLCEHEPNHLKDETVYPTHIRYAVGKQTIRCDHNLIFSYPVPLLFWVRGGVRVAWGWHVGNNSLASTSCLASHSSHLKHWITFIICSPFFLQALVHSFREWLCSVSSLFPLLYLQYLSSSLAFSLFSPLYCCVIVIISSLILLSAVRTLSLSLSQINILITDPA